MFSSVSLYESVLYELNNNVKRIWYFSLYGDDMLPHFLLQLKQPKHKNNQNIIPEDISFKNIVFLFFFNNNINKMERFIYNV